MSSLKETVNAAIVRKYLNFEGDEMPTLIESLMPVSPLSEMPIWARLDFAQMIPKTYFWNTDLTDPRHVSEAQVVGFKRIDDVVWIHYTIEWLDGAYKYIWPSFKSVSYGQRVLTGEYPIE